MQLSQADYFCTLVLLIVSMFTSFAIAMDAVPPVQLTINTEKSFAFPTPGHCKEFGDVWVIELCGQIDVSLMQDLDLDAVKETLCKYVPEMSHIANRCHIFLRPQKFWSIWARLRKGVFLHAPGTDSYILLYQMFLRKEHVIIESCYIGFLKAALGRVCPHCDGSVRRLGPVGDHLLTLQRCHWSLQNFCMKYCAHFAAMKDKGEECEEGMYSMLTRVASEPELRVYNVPTEL